MIKVGNTLYRNLEEQVQFLTDYYDVNQGLVQWGIRVVGKVASENELPDPATYDGEYGDAFAVGTSAPYSFYIWTRESVEGEPAYWFPFGPISIVGPEGKKGDKGDKGDKGEATKIEPVSSTADNTDTSGFNLGDFILQTQTGNMYMLVQGPNGQHWQYILNIKGPQGIKGDKGAQGPKGEQGPQGPKGDTGDVGGFINIWGTLTDTSQLPTPASLNNLTIAYLIGTNTPYDLWVQIGENSDTAVWQNTGPFNAATAVTVNNSYQNIWNADTKLDKPAGTPKVNNLLKVKSVGEDGTFVSEWADESRVDVQINGTSIVQNGVANIPYGTDQNVGVIKTTTDNGLFIQLDGSIRTFPAATTRISRRDAPYMPITIKNMDFAVKAAMCDGKGDAWTDMGKAAARSRMGVINGSTGNNFSFPLNAIPGSAEQLYTDTNGNKTLCRMTKANFLTLAPDCTDEMYERMLQGALVTQNDGAGAAVSGTLITYPPRYVGVGMRIPQEWLNASTLLSVMEDRRIAFFPNFETGHESDIYFVYDGGTKPIIDIIVY